MKGLVRVLLFSLSLGPGVAWASPEPFRCTIRGPSTFPWGSTSHFDVEILNQTGRDILLVGSLDGSDVRMRYPHCYFEVFDTDGRSTVAHPGRCGVVSPLSKVDFVPVAAGGSFDPFMSERGSRYPHYMSAATFRKPGEYRVRFVYSTESEHLGAWMTWWSEELLDADVYDTRTWDRSLEPLLARVPKARVVSNEIRIHITEKPR